ncbi:acyl-CoA dehydrogenase family protein [Tropicimonas sediminicola]|uniref:Acyl-CoA dehydrogenase n=1 Tax=Tropicimonas sediminicola TaxID=1031541 RepID=A0A239FBF9_9RHOB|nr:acyl-CoA dehydrogenase family protein [Tropicimonas sediminicola]SNS54256.1 hypothetical protein SAMN05421757_102596 [Tropicimonas sediminicola]
MKPFQAPLEDILFTLNDVAGAGELPDYDADLTAEIAGHFASFAEAEIAPLDEPGDRKGCRLEGGRVLMPDGFDKLFRAFAEQGWQGLTAPEAYGGQGLDATLLAVTSEIFTGANHALQMVTGLVPGAIRTLLAHGTEAQRAAHIPRLASGGMLATMCLTEPGAGSDLSRIRCRAEPAGDGWQLTGEKIFISGGDQNLSERILHLVLARTSDDGIRGLSLFLCPCTRRDGRRNGVSVTRIEEKMGLHASPTCQLAFDGAEAELIGDEGQGLRAMFTMMNHARADVALQGVAHAARATDIARHYAAERVQGRGPDGAPVALEAHADVRRMLDRMDALALGGRALAHLAVVAMERGDAEDLVEALTPIAKVHCTEAGIEAANLGVQVLGGYGYLAEYRIEQTYRDARITAIYEGANGIHARALVTRLMPGRSGDALERFLEAEAGEAVEGVTAWKAARRDLLGRSGPTPAAHDFMALTAEVLLQCLWQRMLSASERHPDPERIRRVGASAVATGRERILFHAAMVRLAA